MPNTNISRFYDAVQETVDMGYNAIKLGFVPYAGYDVPLPAVRHIGRLLCFTNQLRSLNRPSISDRSASIAVADPVAYRPQ